ncbi:SusD family protein [Chitinophaga costaii]|uniref:SusD family protein n=1 Tax=Chitinophaga costaii TaxID=1335309 RepID=A0A1C4EVR6_9BACT|nr:RagB/SusD family nutrient uptake outer membrane protein [Chitinophaga costaii]PUZ21624.1 RagB/SusD family nutrient uptake outer membrane protein [Chitinophaga costaii]SCC47566.1 SusD family protein [Chitinophaga costaii]
MKIVKNRVRIVISLYLCLTSISCKKYLNKISDDSLTVPSSLDDYQNLIDADKMYIRNSPSIQDISSDDILIDETQLNSLTTIPRNTYLWSSDIFDGQTNFDWNACYKGIYYCNLVLEGIQKYELSNGITSTAASIKGAALYYRGFFHFNLAQVFAKSFSNITTSSDLGLPYKTNSIVDEKVSRESLPQFYTHLIDDIKESVKLLPKNAQTQYRNRPSKHAAYSILARIYLSMSDYYNAELYADSSLQISNALLDYNVVNGSSVLPFGLPYISEVICLSSGPYYILRPPVDTVLYNSYDSLDLRKNIFFSINAVNGNHEFKANYSGGFYPFTGPAIDEVNLILAECLARRGEFDRALSIMNKLLLLRYKAGAYVAHTRANTPDILAFILKERRKELLFRGLRWSDLKRFNLEGGSFAKTLTRTVAGEIYSLPPNDNKYIFPIPPDEIKINPMPQNPR